MLARCIWVHAISKCTLYLIEVGNDTNIYIASLSSFKVVLGNDKKDEQEVHKLITCLCPLQPRCGDAEVMKFMGSSPAIFPLTSCSLYKGSLVSSNPSSV